MTVIADNKKRVVLAKAKPGDRFDVQVSADGYVLHKLEPVEPRRGGAGGEGVLVC